MLTVLREKGHVDISERELTRLRHLNHFFYRAPNGSIHHGDFPHFDFNPCLYAHRASQEAWFPSVGREKSDRLVIHDSEGNKTGEAMHEQRPNIIMNNESEATFQPTVLRRHSLKYPHRATIGVNPNLYSPPTAAELTIRASRKREAEAARTASVAERQMKRRGGKRNTELGRAVSDDEGLARSMVVQASSTLFRFPSEMPLTETKVVLGINHAEYQEVRSAFESICSDLNINRKKDCKHWEDAKIQLIAACPCLSATIPIQAISPIVLADIPITMANVLSKEADPRKLLALDLLCMDVTKKNRVKSTRLTLTEAKKRLGLTPNEILTIRESLKARLAADGFTSKLQSGESHWKELRNAWTKEHDLKDTAAANVIGSDVMKRLNDKSKRRLMKQSQDEQGLETEGDRDDEKMDSVVDGHGKQVSVSTNAGPQATKVTDIAFTPETDRDYGYGVTASGLSYLAPYTATLPDIPSPLPSTDLPIDPELLRYGFGHYKPG